MNNKIYKKIGFAALSLVLISMAVFLVISSNSKTNEIYFVKSFDKPENKKINTSSEYKDFCKSNKDFEICKVINEGYFHSYFYGECLAVQQNDPKKCETLEGEENVTFCKNNLVVYNAIVGKNPKKCDELGKTEYGTYDKKNGYEKKEGFNELGHTDKSNIDFCKSLVELSINFDNSKLEKLTISLFGDIRSIPRVHGMVTQESSFCSELSGIDEKIKCLIYTKSVSCHSLDENAYIYKIINNTNHFYDEG